MNSISTPEPSLSSRAMLCSLSISMWSARKHDPEASEEIAQRHGAQPDAGRYHSADRGERRKQILRGVYLERQSEILRGVYPERQSEILRFAQNDSEGETGETVSGTVPAVSPLPADPRNGT